MLKKNLTEEGVKKLTFESARTQAQKAWWEKWSERLETKHKRKPTHADRKEAKEEFAKLAWQQIDYSDAWMPGLVLRVNYGGKKVWRVLYYVKKTDENGKNLTVPRLHKLNIYPVLKLKDAREAARKFLADPDAGLKRARNEVRTEAVAGNFKEVAENFIKRHVVANKLRSKKEYERCLAKYVYPRWERLKFSDIRRGDVNDLLDEIVDNHGPRQADMVLAIISKMMGWYEAQKGHDDYKSPIVRGMKRGKTVKRERWLLDDEIRNVWNACDDMGRFGAIVKVLLLTGQRRDKVATMKWADLKDGVWTIPKEKNEKGTAGTIRLPQAALDIINAQDRLGKNFFVFAVNGKGPFNSFSQRKGELDAKLRKKKMQQWVLHDLRRTARGLMTRAGIRPDVAELALGHSIKGIQGVYDDVKEYRPMIEHALQCVANEVDKILNSADSTNIVPFKEAGSR